MTPPGSGSALPRQTPRTQSGARDVSEAPDDTVDLRRVGRALWRRKWLIVATSVLSAAVFFLVTMAQERIYTATATVMLDPREQQVVATQEQVVSDLQLSNPILESEVALLRSASLLSSVIDEIGIDRFDGIDPALDPPGPAAWLVGSLKAWLRPAGRDEAAVVAPDVARENRIIAALRDGLTVRRIGDSYVIEILVATPDPVLSAEVSNTLAETYIKAQLADRQRVAEDATRWLAAQVETRRIDLARAEAAVEAYKRDQLVETGASEAVLQQQLMEMNAEIARARSERATEEARLVRIETLLAERGGAAAAEALSSQYLATLRERRSTLMREDARLATSLGPSHPDRAALLLEIAQLDTAVAEEVQIIAEGHRNEIDILSTRERALQADMDAIEAQLADISTSSLRLRELEREAEARRSGFEDMLGRLGETRAQVEIQRAEAKFVNAAQIPLGPSGPRVNLMTAFGLTLGLTLGLGLALMLELFGPGFTQAAELERVTGIPVLAALPAVRTLRRNALLRLLKDEGFSILNERIRQLRMTLMLTSAPETPISVVLLSSVQDEGKTTTALALAKSFADAGKRTILVDLDTRRSATLSRFSDAARADLGDWLEGRATLEETIHDVSELGIWLTGTQRSEALLADAMHADKIREMIDELAGHFDVVIADAPPVLAVSDGLSIASAVDHMLYLVRYRTTSRKSLAYGLSTLTHVGLRPTGLVMTVADVDSDPDVYAQGYAPQ